MSGGNQQTSTSTSQPYAAAKPLLDWSMQQGFDLAKQGRLAQPLTMSTVVPYADQTMKAFNGMQDTAYGAMPYMNQAYGAVGNVVNNGGYNDAMRQGQNTMNPFASGWGDIGYGEFNSIANQARQNPYQGTFSGFSRGAGDVTASKQDNLSQAALNNPYSFNDFAGGGGDVSGYNQRNLIGSATQNPAMQGYQDIATPGRLSTEKNLSAVAQGKFLNGGDPYFENVLQQATDKTADQINLLASSMGRTASGANQGVLAREVGDLQARARSDQYNTERGRQVEAANLIDQNRRAQEGIGLSALGGLSSAYQAGQGQALNAANSYSSILGANQDRRMSATAQGAGNYLAGLGQSLNAANSYSSIMGGNQDRRLSATAQGAGNYLAGLGQSLNAANSYSSILGANQDRRMQGAAQGSNIYQTGLNQQQNALMAGKGIQADNYARRMNAGTSLYNMGQGGLNNMLGAAGQLPGQYQAMLAPWQTMRDIGGAYEDLYGRQLNDQLRIGQETMNSPLTNIQRLLAISSGAGGYGTTQQTAQGPNNTFGQILGGGLGLLSLLA